MSYNKPAVSSASCCCSSCLASVMFADPPMPVLNRRPLRSRRVDDESAPWLGWCKSLREALVTFPAGHVMIGISWNEYNGTSHLRRPLRNGRRWHHW